MQRRINTIPRATIARILMNAGAKRVSAPATNALADIVHDISLKIASRAVEITKHAKRKTVHEGDIKLAAKK